MNGRSTAKAGRSRRTGAALGALVAALSLAGCGSGGGSPTASDTGAPQASSGPHPGKESFAAYRECLTQHGVNPPTGRPSPGAPRPSMDAAAAQAFRDARQACANLRPAGGLTAGGIHSGPRRQFRECMKQHGVTLPEPPRRTARPGEGPSPEPSSGRGGMLAGLDLKDPTVHAALEACKSIIFDNGATPAPAGGAVTPADTGDAAQ